MLCLSNPKGNHWVDCLFFVLINLSRSIIAKVGKRKKKKKSLFWAFLFKDKYNRTHNVDVEDPQVKH
jgi:hypothetical protein